MRKALIITILIFCNFINLFGYDSESIKINMLIFLSENCEICDDFLINQLPDLESKYYIEYTLYYDYEENSKALLREIEKEFGKVGDFPIILMGNDLIKGDEIYSKLETTIEDYVRLGGCCVPLLYEFEQNLTAEDSHKFPVHIAHIFGNDSKENQNTNNIFDELKAKYPLLEIKEFDIETENGMQKNKALCKFYNFAEGDYDKTPKIFIGEDVLIGSQVDFDSIKMLIVRYQDDEEVPAWEKILNETKGE
ncbi:hypothetical protein H8E88_35770 [candidate division KSB1 bacterium]|nr:hypothetical protein [candidate division KSB1 bacterium]